MDAIESVAEVTSSKESDRQLALLNWARMKIDRIAKHSDSSDRLNDLVNFMARFTREYFGFQERMLSESAANHEYLAERKATHAEFRRRLAHIYADVTNGNATAPERLSALCHELWLDLQTQRDEFSATIHDGSLAARLRRSPRADDANLHDILRFDS
jgi:hypothetical protein